jgi:RHS repeat-associated protein
VNNQTQALATLTKHLCPKKRTYAGVRPACRHGRFHHLGRVKTFNVVYDLSAARLKNATLKTPSTALRLQEDYLYDGLANVTQRTQAWDTGSFTETFAYDVLNRLSTSTVSGQAAQSFTFDDTGNITTKTGVGSYVYPAQGPSAVRPHAIQSIPGVGTGNFGYDTNGNLTSIPGVMTGTWTSYDMPQSITKNGTGGTNASTFTYGPEHQRTKQVRSDGLTVVYAGAQEVETKGGAVTVKTYWPYGVGVEIDRPVAGAAPTNELNWMHVDRLGSPIAISDNIGSLRERLAYDAWGKRRTLNGAPLNGTATPNSIDGITDNRGFTGHEMLDLLDLVHMNGRIYDPLFGKFLSADPLIQDPMNGQSYNRYSYVLNNPTNLTDPTGFAAACGGTEIGSNIARSCDDFEKAAEKCTSACFTGTKGEDGKISVKAAGDGQGNATKMGAGYFIQKDAKSGDFVMGREGSDLARARDAVGNFVLPNTMRMAKEGTESKSGDWLSAYLKFTGNSALDQMRTMGPAGNLLSSMIPRSEYSSSELMPAAAYEQANIVGSVLLTSGAGALRNTATKGLPEGALFAQEGYSPKFSDRGALKGQSFSSVVQDLRSGARNPSSIQVDYVVRGDVVIIHNTRSANALEAAGVPRSQFNAVNKTGNPAVEARVDRQLARNPGGPFDSARMEK